MPRVILFRKPQPGDVYESILADKGYTAQSLAALDDELVLDELKNVISQGGHAWDGVVITSRRGAEAWVAAVATVGECQTGWDSLPLYSPGDAVIRTLDQAALPAAFRLTPGATALSAAALAPLILAASRRISLGDGEDGGIGSGKKKSTEPVSQNPFRPFLLLTGDKTLRDLGDALREAGRDVVEVKVYETRERARLGRDLEMLNMDDIDWVAFFSPSSAGYVLPYLDLVGMSKNRKKRLRVAAIGSTTAGYLHACRVHVDAVADTPDAEGLTRAIANADEGVLDEL